MDMVNKRVSIGLRYASEISSVEGLVSEVSDIGILVSVKKTTVFYPWTSVIFVKFDD